MNYPYEETGKRIFLLRKMKKLTSEQLAEKADISTQFLADIEKGRKNMTVTTLRKLASALHITADFIINGEESQNINHYEIIQIYNFLPPEKQSYALQLLRTFADAVKYD